MFLADFSKTNENDEKKKGNSFFKPEKLTRSLLPSAVVLGGAYSFKKSIKPAEKVTEKWGQNIGKKIRDTLDDEYTNVESKLWDKRAKGFNVSKEIDYMNNFEKLKEKSIGRGLRKVKLVERTLPYLGGLAGAGLTYGAYRGGKALINKLRGKKEVKK